MTSVFNKKTNEEFCYICVRLPAEILKELDKMAAEASRSRTGQVLHLIKEKLKEKQ